MLSPFVGCEAVAAYMNKMRLINKGVATTDIMADIRAPGASQGPNACSANWVKFPVTSGVSQSFSACAGLLAQTDK